jgi:hypothetical protein
MLFSKKRTILFINNEKITWALGEVPSGNLFDVRELPWSEENLNVALGDIASNFTKKVRVVFGEEYSYVTRIINSHKKIEKADAQSLIPEELDEAWDTSGAGEKSQLMAVQQKIFSLLKKDLVERKIEVESLEAESVAIARIISKIDKSGSFLFVKSSNKDIIGIVKEGMVVFTKVYPKSFTSEEMADFVKYVSAQNGINFEQAYVDGDVARIGGILNGMNVAVQEMVLNPMVGAGQKNDIAGSDEKVLNIVFGEPESVAPEKKESNFSRKEKILLIAFLAVILISSVAVFLILKSRKGF